VFAEFAEGREQKALRRTRDGTVGEVLLEQEAGEAGDAVSRLTKNLLALAARAARRRGR
jgi:hypothetical protein